ncbi:UNVERIFIED_CONTAM: hypothetical protein PYX00_001577 [Menopon gallinae]|uniref:Small subunit processome component 20 homolog n=1 Tax=Menopon gallinae TaxID=328185 RepID=A0AAW2IEI1_9NEOP
MSIFGCKVLIRYLLGVLYCNFKLIWEPTFEILASYATKIPKLFWGVFHKQLTYVTQLCKERKFPDDLNLPTMDEFLLKNVRFLIVEDKADYNNYRYLLWKSMTLFADLCESKNRDVVSMYLTFLDEELLKSSPRHNLTINIKQNEGAEDDNDEGNAESPNTEETSVKSKSGSSVIKWAVAHLTLLSNFKSPKLCYKEAELRSSYYDLLEHKNVEIQKLALECLFTYKFKYMMPYKQHLRNLIDEVKFRDEIVHFQIDKENGVIQESHREELMPVVMRILYNKMVSRSAVKRGSKGSAALLKRSVVFRFLAGSSDSEMEVFLQMAFRTFHSYQDADTEGFVKVMNSVDLEHVTPPKKLLSIVNLVDIIIEHFGGLMTVKIQRYILKILFSVGAITCGISSQRDKVFSGYITSIKNLRIANSDCLGKFFDRLSFPWIEDEINTIFEIFVWDGLEKLPMESLYNPTAVLRLFSTWSENPRYFKLFARHKKDDKSFSALPFITALLLNEKTQNSVTSYIIRIIENLLTLKEEITEENEDETPIEIDYILPIDEAQIEKLSLKEELNYGSKILIPHVGSILTYLRRKLEKSNNALDKTELAVLSKVTELATSPENSDSLMTILLRLLTVKKMPDEEILMDMMTTVENLAKIVNKPLSYLRSFAVLLGTIDSVDCRKMLTNALANIQNRCPELNESLSVVRDLNANDSKWVSQPDFDKRLDAYKKVKTLASEGQMDLDFALMVLHNSFYVVRCDTDLSLRDSASYCLKEICPILANNWKDNQNQNQFWIDSILRTIHLALIGKDENIQTFAISLLGVMARECGDHHPVLKDLSVYANKTDLEVDLFENAVHLQGHRRVRSLLRFVSLSKNLTKAPNTRTLAQFILPLATRYLCNQKYIEKNTLIDAAISCLGAVCKYLPWHKYQTVLRYYLSKLQGKIDYQKQLVRIVIAILDSFHFDISKAEYAPAPTASEEKTSENDKESPSDKKSTPDDDSDSRIDEDEEEKELDDELNEDKDIEEVNEEKMETSIPTEQSSALKSFTILNPAEAARVQRAMTGSLLTQLTKAIGERTQKDDTHKSNIKSLGPDRDSEEVLRIPIAVTLVKLLQKISKKMLDDHLSGIIMRLCTFLKSKMESVRRVARETLEQIIASIGPKYLKVILGEMKAVLTKGFQLHVLVFTMHSVLHAVQSQLQAGDVDDNLQILLEACKNDVFGQPSEEKDVKQILAKHKEVKSTKSYRLINLIAQHITEKCLTDLLMPIKNVLETSHSHKAITKCRECLRHTVLGLCANEFISSENLFIYIYGVTSESIPKLSAPEKVEVKKKNPKEKQDCFIIPEEPKNRIGVLSNPVKKNPKSNSHILLEFGFQLLQFILKKEKLQSTSNFKSFLDPLGGVLVKAVESQHIKVSTLALNCLCKIFKYNLPSVRSEMQSVINELFAILHKYAAPGLSKGETFDLVLVTFKTLCVIMRDTNRNGIDVEKLKILLVYVEQDIYDNHRQASAFNILKTILKMKLDVPELNDLIKKVAELSISSELAHVRLQARQCVFQYIMDYPIGEKLEYYIGFFVSQLSFAVESGRQSALEMIHSFITHFPQKVLNEQCEVFLITLGARLVNDDSPECKKAVSGIVKSMLLRLDENYRNQLFDILILWLKQKKLGHRRLSAQIIGIYVTIEKEEFAKRLPKLLPLIHMQFSGKPMPGKFVRLSKDEEGQNRGKDYNLFQVLQLLLKICSHCPDFLTDSQNQESLNLLAETCQSLLCHPHEWVRLASMQFLGSLFNSIDPSQVAKVLNGKKVKTQLSFLQPSSLRRRIRSLILDHVSQLIPNAEIGQEFIEQVTKNLVYFARVLKDVSKTEGVNNEEEEDEEDDEEEEMVNEEEREEDSKEESKNLSILWLIRKMRRIVNREIVETPLSYTLRTGVLKWIGAVSVCFSKEELTEILYHLIAPVVRERDLLEGEHSEGPFKTLVTEVTQLLKKKVGFEEFTREAVKVQKRLLDRRTERRTQRAQEFVTNPERAAKRKIEKQVKKKMLKKRKIESFKAKGIKKFPRKRKAEEDIF